MHNAERTARLWSLAAALALWGCQSAEPAAKAPPPLLAATHYLDEPFALGTAQCRLLSAAPMLTEASGENQALVAEDLSVVELSFACADAHGTPVPFSSLSARLTWVDRTRTSHAPITTTTLARTQPEHVVFEVPSGQDGLLRTRSYDANTGAPLGPRELGAARLYLEPQAIRAAPARSLFARAPEGALRLLQQHEHARAIAQARVVIAPWPRVHDGALDALLERLAHSLTSEAPDAGLSETEAGEAALATVRPLYRRALERFAPKVLALRAIANIDGQPQLTLSLASSTSNSEVPPVASFRLELALGAHGLPTIARLLDPEGTRSAIECAIQTADLRARVERAQSEAARRAVADAAPEANCNALGVLVPHACTLADANLVHTALRVQTRCGPSGAFDLLLHEESRAPSDFEVKLRRGRSDENLAGEPRYSVSLSHSGQVQFEGLYTSLARGAARFTRVSARGPREGRTSQALLAALWGAMTRLHWTELEPATSKHCSEGERGDTISVLANGRTLTVRDRAGCRAGLSSDQLTGLRRAIERVAAVDAWTTPSPTVFSRDAEIWVVAAE